MDQSVTSLSLLHRIQASRNDENAWREFVVRYGTRIYEWCVNRKLNPDDAEDVTQDVLLKLARNFEKFEYDPAQSFRGWLRRVTENAIKDFIRSQANRDQARGGSTIVALMAQEPRQDGFSRSPGKSV